MNESLYQAWKNAKIKCSEAYAELRNVEKALTRADEHEFKARKIRESGDPNNWD